MKRALLVTAALVAAVAVWTALSLPPHALALDSSWSDGTLAGIVHVHTNRSDGLSDPDTVAAVAARAGLKFIVFTDHGDGTRTPDPPVYRSGVLCLDGVEISTTGGHYVVLDLGAAPYPLGGEPRDVVDDVRRLGGFGITAHPDSPKGELAWRDWSPKVDGLEVMNPDTGWRVHLYRGGIRARLQLLAALATYPFRSTETIGALLTPSSEAKATWSELTRERAVVGIAGVDAHAKLEVLASGDGRSRFSLPIPGYESSFRAISVHVAPTGAMTGDAVVDASRIVAAIRRGQLYAAVDAWATPPHFNFTASGSGGTVEQGGAIALSEAPVLRVRHNGGDAFITTVWNGPELVTPDRHEREFSVSIGSIPGAYRVEVRDPRHPDGPPWITSNPIYVRGGSQAASDLSPMRPAASQRPEDRAELFDGRTVKGWTIESDRSSLSAVNVTQVLTGPELRIRYGLSGGSNVGQFAGAAVDTLSGAGAFDRVTFTIRSDRPMRVSVQVRAEVRGAPPERWQRSVYADVTERTQSVFFDDMRPVGTTHTPTPPTATIRNIMFIADMTNSAPGSSGNLWLKNVRLEK